MDATPARVGLKLKLLRIARRIRQRDLARHVGLPPSVLSDIENGWRKPTEAQIEAICKVLGTASEGLEAASPKGKAEVPTQDD